MRGAAALIVCAVLGCSRALDRCDHVLASDAGLLWSNSPVLLEGSALRRADELLEVSYGLLFENRAAGASLLLSRARAELGGRPGTVVSECRALHQRAPRDLTLAPGSRTRIDCRLRLTPSGMQLLARRDAELLLLLPVERAGSVQELSFSYRLYYEDAT